jgi:hypothetical protein
MYLSFFLELREMLTCSRTLGDADSRVELGG